MTGAAAAPAALPRPFAFLDGTSALHDRLGPLLADLLTDLPERHAALAAVAAPGSPVAVVAEARGRLEATGWTADRVYCSLQAATADGGFDAVTLNWRAGRGGRWSRLPEDPYLPGLAATAHRLRGTAGDPDAGTPGADGFPLPVLRYVPLRRFTYRRDGRIVKVKRASRLRDAWDRASAVAAALPGSGVRVPALLGLDEDTCSYAQADVPGVPLADQARGEALTALLAEAGAVHARFHAVPATYLPAGDGPDAVVAAARRDAAWAAAMLPALSGVLAAATRVLATPPAPADPVTCHGDLVPSHLLGAPGDWTVIDLDLAHRGDPYRDLALFVAGLAYDVPALADGVADDPTHAAAVAAYLGGYAERAGWRPDPDRLRRHLLAAHLHHANLLATKDRAHPAAVAGTAARIAAVLDGALPGVAA